MESFACNNCLRRSPVTPSTRYIGCQGCRRVSSIGNADDGGFSRRSKDWSLEPGKKKTEAMNFYQGFRNGFSRVYPQQVQRVRPTPPPPPPPPVVTLPRGKRAVLCGVSYKNQKCELKGPSLDVKNVRDLLVQEYRFPSDSILILAEEESCIPPTRKNIEYAFQWLMRGVQPGDSLVFYFAGHGKQQPCHYGDEIDGFDETICPMDFETNGEIVDDYINYAIVRPLPQDVTLHAIVDSCHSGTILDLPYVYNNKTGKWYDDSPPCGAYKGTSGGKAICFSACEDYQLAANTSAFSIDKEKTGAMTSSFVRAIKSAFARRERITYEGILDSIHLILKQTQKSGSFGAGTGRTFDPRILQDPLLSASPGFNVNTEFRL